MVVVLVLVCESVLLVVAVEAEVKVVEVVVDLLVPLLREIAFEL